MFNKMSFMKLMFLMMLIMSTLITINSSSWFNAWMGMEINLMSFIPLMLNNSKKNKISNSMMIYFIIQASASSIMLMMIIMMKMQFNINKTNFIMNIIQLSIMLKLGVSPLHWWMPKILLNLNWMNCFILLTWQKIAPLFLIMSMNNNFMIYFTAMLSIIMGTILGMNQTSIKLILMYSSINHLGWMLMNLLMNFNLLYIYFIMYMLINLMICMMMNNMNINFMNQLFKNLNQNINQKLILMSLFLSLAGMPPFLGFLPKMLTLMLMLKNNLLIESMLMIMMTVLSLSFYINPLLTMFIFTKFNNKWTSKNNYITKIMFSIMMINMMFILILMTPNLLNLM